MDLSFSIKKNKGATLRLDNIIDANLGSTDPINFYKNSLQTPAFEQYIQERKNTSQMI